MWCYYNYTGKRNAKDWASFRTGGVWEEIDGVVQQYAKDNSYDYIFNDRVLIFKQDSNDLSQNIIDKLNAGK